MIQVNLSNIHQFISLPYEAALAPRLHIAHKHLQNQDGVGCDFTGWVHLPENYDREEFVRIQGRRSGSRATLRRWWSLASAGPIWAPGA